MTPAELTIEFAQRNQPWTVSYSPGVIRAANVWDVQPGADVRADVPHILASHNVLHAAKTVGKLAAVFERLDHTGQLASVEDIGVIADMAADLLTEALRLANLYRFDLAAVFVRRVEEKNAVNILNLEK